MKKFNKKGFTLIEMLVVIAIIAVLVAIIIPVVGNSTLKAKAAADAANLRSVLAEATTDYLNGQDDDTGLVQFTATSKTFTARSTAPESKSLDSANLYVAYDNVNSQVVVCYEKGGSYYTINDFAKVAEEGGTLAATVAAVGAAG